MVKIHASIQSNITVALPQTKRLKGLIRLQVFSLQQGNEGSQWDQLRDIAISSYIVDDVNLQRDY